MRSGPQGFLTPVRLGLLLGLVLCAALYYPGLRGDFIFDDWPNIVQNTRLQVDQVDVDSVRAAAFSADSGVLKRPVSMLTFWANYYTTGLDPFYFKLTNLLIHLFNGVALYWLSLLLLHRVDSKDGPLTLSGRKGIALFAALIWLVHPLNLTSVLYVVQRMTSLSATFAILGLITYVVGRARLSRGRTGFPLILGGLVGFGLLSVLAKENGVLLPFYMAAVEFGLLQFAGLPVPAKSKLKALFAFTVAAPLVGAALFLVLDPGWIAHQYQLRDFTVTERLLTEARALWLYIVWLMAPTRASLGLFHDDIATSHGLLDPPSTLLCVIGIVAVSAAAIRFRRRAPLFAFAVLWYLAGHLLESSVIALELVHEHRNYLPMFGPLLAMVYGLYALLPAASMRARLALPAVFVVVYSVVTFGRSLDWASLQTLQISLARDHPNSARANYEAGTALGNLALRKPELAPGLYDETKSYLERATSLDSSSVSPLFGLILLDGTNHRPIDEAAMDRLAARLAEMPLNTTVIDPFRSLVEWTTHGAVMIPNSLVGRLFEAALDNPTGNARTRAMLMAIWSSYYNNVLGNAQEAVGLAMTATEVDPSEPVHHMNLAYLAASLGNRELAARELATVARLDPIGRYAPQARALAKTLSEADSTEATGSQDVALR